MGVGTQTQPSKPEFWNLPSTFKSVRIQYAQIPTKASIPPRRASFDIYTRSPRMNQCWGLHLPICADPLIPGFRRLFEMFVTLRPSALEILRPGRCGEDMLVHLGIESITPSYRRNLFILSPYDDMLAGAGAARRCTYLCLVIIGHDNARSYYRVPSSACSSDTPFDHLAPHGDAGESAITNACFAS